MPQMRWVPLALALAFAAGCGTSAREEAVRFHEHVSVATRLVEAADLEFLVSLLPLLRGEKFDPAPVKAAHESARKALAEAVRVSSASTPPDSTSARALATTHTAFLERQKQTIESDFVAVVKLVEDAQADPAQRRSKVRDLFVRVQDADYTDFSALRKAQKAFADEHKLSLRDTQLPRDHAISFLTALGVANGRLELGGKELGAALGPAFGDQPVKNDRVQAALDRARATLAQVKQIVAALEPPAGKAAKELHEAQTAYLERQDAVFAAAFPELMRIAHDPVLTADTRRQRLDAGLRSMQDSERGDLARLSAAREAFIKEHRLIRR